MRAAVAALVCIAFGWGQGAPEEAYLGFNIGGQIPTIDSGRALRSGPYAGLCVGYWADSRLILEGELIFSSNPIKYGNSGNQNVRKQEFVGLLGWQFFEHDNMVWTLLAGAGIRRTTWDKDQIKLVPSSDGTPVAVTVHENAPGGITRPVGVVGIRLGVPGFSKRLQVETRLERSSLYEMPINELMVGLSYAWSFSG